MTMERTNAEMPAFPINIPGHGDNGASGLSKRELLAAMAMQGLLAAHPSGEWPDSCGKAPFSEWLALNAVDAADALLAALSAAKEVKV